MEMKFNYDNQFLITANKINSKKYEMMGISDEKLIKKLVELDAQSFTNLYLHRRLFETEFDNFLDKMLSEEKDLIK